MGKKDKPKKRTPYPKEVIEGWKESGEGIAIRVYNYISDRNIRLSRELTAEKSKKNPDREKIESLDKEIMGYRDYPLEKVYRLFDGPLKKYKEALTARAVGLVSTWPPKFMDERLSLLEKSYKKYFKKWKELFPNRKLGNDEWSNLQYGYDASRFDSDKPTGDDSELIFMELKKFDGKPGDAVDAAFPKEVPSSPNDKKEYIIKCRKVMHLYRVIDNLKEEIKEEETGRRRIKDARDARKRRIKERQERRRASRKADKKMDEMGK